MGSGILNPDDSNGIVSRTALLGLRRAFGAEDNSPHRRKALMKLCMNCETVVDAAWRCPNCLQSPSESSGFLQLSPEFNAGSHGYDASAFETFARLEAGSFWFKSRNALLTESIRKYSPAVGSFLEVGCGTGYVLSAIEGAFPSLSVFGSEALVEGLEFAAKRTSTAKLFQMDARKMPFKDEFDIIGAFDVLEHIAEDELVLNQMFKSLSANGIVVLTVPQHPSLWSPADDYALHERRYTRRELISKVKNAGFSVAYVTSFVTLLLPLMAASRFWNRRSGTIYEPESELDMNPAFQSVLGSIMWFERMIMRTGVSLAIGGSLLLIAKKEVSND